MTPLLEKKLVGSNGFGGKFSGKLSLDRTRENALAGRSSSAGPDREAARCMAEAREDVDEGMRI